MELDLSSSYEKNRYGCLFYSIVRTNKPKTIVELGTKNGYSALFMAGALEDNKEGKLFCYDLWEDYSYKSCQKQEAHDKLKKFVDKEIVELHQQDAFFVYRLYSHVDILHVDLSNDGYLLERIIDQWLDKCGIIIVEGGSEERDNVEWMKKYNRKPIKSWLEANKNRFSYFTFEPFPSLTIIKK